MYLRRFDYNQGRQISLLEGVNVRAFYNALGSANVLNYIQDSKGIALSTSYPIKRSFARFGCLGRLRHFEHQDVIAGRHNLFHLSAIPSASTGPTR